MRVKVKICGITRLCDALDAAKYGADALGFNFVHGTRRYVSPEVARRIRMQLPPFLSAVGVFANESREEVEKIAEYCRLHCVQLHGDENPDYCDKIKHSAVIKAFRVSCAQDIDALDEYEVDGYLLDADVKGMLGGTGRSIDPQIAREACRFGPIILAGGLTPDNVWQAVEIARPLAVDVASGVEESPGLKSKTLMQAFIRNAKKEKT